MKIAEIMTRSVVSVSPETKVATVARLMADKDISGVPVVDNHERCTPLSRQLSGEPLLGS